MSSTPIRVEFEGGVATLTIDRPQVRNAFDLATAEALSRALDEVERSSDVQVVVLTGSGGTFSAGMDLKAFARSGERPVTDRGGFGLVGSPPRTPSIAAVEGPALGGGLEIALACDLIVAGSTASFGLPEVRRGLVAAGGGAVRVAQRLPRNLALELVLTGEPISAQRAAAIGLVNCVVPSGEALAEARRLGAQIAANAPLAISASKDIVDASRLLTTEQAMADQVRLVDAVRQSADAREGAAAFVERRPPRWSGS